MDSDTHIRKKISRGKSRTVFFAQCLTEIEVCSLHLQG
ncbi:hypothetical protein [Erythrobacter fulvus]